MRLGEKEHRPGSTRWKKPKAYNLSLPSCFYPLSRRCGQCDGSFVQRYHLHKVCITILAILLAYWQFTVVSGLQTRLEAATRVLIRNNKIIEGYQKEIVHLEGRLSSQSTRAETMENYARGYSKEASYFQDVAQRAINQAKEAQQKVLDLNREKSLYKTQIISTPAKKPLKPYSVSVGDSRLPRGAPRGNARVLAPKSSKARQSPTDIKDKG